MHENKFPNASSFNRNNALWGNSVSQKCVVNPRGANNYTHSRLCTSQSVLSRYPSERGGTDRVYTKP